MDAILRTIRSPQDLKGLSLKQLEQLAGEIREALCRIARTRTAHFASNLGVVELALALHTTADFSHDRLIWDTGHQIYPHKMLTGRYPQIDTIRTRGGLMGYPNPAESPFDLFMTGHAGSSVATALGLRCGDDLLRTDENRHTVVVIGDGAFPSGIVFEAMNHVAGLKKKLIIVLNDNKMSICPRVGGLGEYLDRLRVAPFYTGLKAEIQKLLNHMPLLGDPVERLLAQTKDAIKAGLLGGMLFEEMGCHYLGPVDGHNIRQLQKYLGMARGFDGPVLLHVVTEKGHGFKPAVDDPVFFHTPSRFPGDNGAASRGKCGRSYTWIARETVLDQMHKNPRVAAITAAMCQGTMLEPIREQFPERFFDVGICESHAVAFAAGLAKTGLRPIVDIYSTFLQRGYDQLFQEVSLQDLPVTFLLDRAGLVGPDGPTHHGVFDLAYLRPFPNFVVMAPGDALDLPGMLQFALEHDGPTAIRYPKTPSTALQRHPTPIELGTAEVLSWGEDGMLIACGTLLESCVEAAYLLESEGLDVGVINARFVKPLDTQTILRAVEHSPMVVTVEEGVLQGGFGSAVLEAASDAGLNTSRIRRMGIPDRYIEHGERKGLLAELGLDAEGIAATCRQLTGRHEPRKLVRQPK